MARIGWGSCVSAARITETAVRASAENLDCFVMIGDMPYTETGLDIFGVDCEHASGTGNLAAPDSWQTANLLKHYQQTHDNNPGIRQLIASTSFYYIWDDHELPGDNWDHSTTQANDIAAIATDQDDVDEIFAQARAAFVQYTHDNPANTDVEAVAEAPPDANAPDSAYGPLYFRATHGDSEVFVLDCISHRDATATAASASKTMLGTNQKAWLKAHLSSSTAKWKFICSGKKTFKFSGADNSDTWYASGASPGYQDELDEILDYIDDGGITNVVWLTGDRHQASVNSLSKAAAEQNNHTDICACPIGVDVSGISGVGGTYVKFINDGGNGQKIGNQADGTTSGKLVDASVAADTGKDFVTAKIRVGDYVYNTTDNTITYVVAVDSATQLSLNDNIMASGEDYVIAKPGQVYGLIETDDDFCHIWLKGKDGTVVWTGVVADGTNYLGDTTDVPINI